MKPVRLLNLLTVLFVALLAACAPGGNEPTAVPETAGEAGARAGGPATVEATSAEKPVDEVTHGGPINDYVSLVDALRFTGASVQPVKGVDQPFFEPQAQVVEINGEAVQIFEFADEDAARAAAATVSDDGSSVGTTMLNWVDTPHFYLVDRLILLYVGSNQEVLSLLQQVLDEPFAGG